MAENREYWTTTGDEGMIKISEDVVASIASIAASETEGVGALNAGGRAGLWGKKNLTKGVKIQFEGEDVAVELCFMAKYGYNIREVGEKVQEAVAASIESMTGLKTVCVNIHVTGIVFEDDAVSPEAVESVPEE